MDISELKQGQKIKIDYEDEIFVAKVKKLTPKFVIIKYDVDGSTEKINLNSFRKRITKIFKSTVRRIVQKKIKMVVLNHLPRHHQKQQQQQQS
jgi:3-phosphoglycerate kinase